MTVRHEQLGTIPSEEEVRQHGFDFRPAWWDQYLPAEWRFVLHDLPTSPRGDGYHHVTRQHLFDLGGGVGPDDPVLTLIACYAWGVGNQGRRVGRFAQTFTKNSPDTLRSKLSAAQSVLLDDGPRAAMQSLSLGGRNRVPHLNSSFFTKFLYAVNPPDDLTATRALIMDKFVAIALNDLDSWGIEEEVNIRPADDYIRWLKHAHALAAELTASSSTEVRADAVEMAYFLHGRRIDQARRQP